MARARQVLLKLEVFLDLLPGLKARSISDLPRPGLRDAGESPAFVEVANVCNFAYLQEHPRFQSTQDFSNGGLRIHQTGIPRAVLFGSRQSPQSGMSSLRVFWLQFENKWFAGIPTDHWDLPEPLPTLPFGNPIDLS